MLNPIPVSDQEPPWALAFGIIVFVLWQPAATTVSWATRAAPPVELQLQHVLCSWVWCFARIMLAAGLFQFAAGYRAENGGILMLRHFDMVLWIVMIACDKLTQWVYSMFLTDARTFDHGALVTCAFFTLVCDTAIIVVEYLAGYPYTVAWLLPHVALLGSIGFASSRHVLRQFEAARLATKAE